MINIGIISGGGKLPIVIGKNLIKKNFQVFFLCIKGFANSSDYINYNYSEVSITSFTDILNQLQKFKIDNIIMVGDILRPSISDLRFDLTTINLIKDYLLESKGDDQLLTTISKFFLKNGYPLFNWKKECLELFEVNDNLTTLTPSKNAKLNKDKGLEIFKYVGKSDIGQSLILQNKLVLGIESVEGTDELLKRCFYYKKKGDNGILLKLSKYKQNAYIDIPTIGLNTLKFIKKYKYEGIYLEKNKCIILDKLDVINFCNQNKIFISTTKKL